MGDVVVSEYGRLRIAVLVSGHGRGSNLAAIIEGCASGEIHGDVVLVVGTRAEAPALMASAMAAAVRAGRLARRAGRIPPRHHATASSAAVGLAHLERR